MEAIRRDTSLEDGSEVPTTTLRLAQYWDTGRPPEEVAQLMASWRSDPAFTYEAYDHTAAELLIETHLDARTLSAFRQCAVPAMQADLFRYCALFALGGLYIDADTLNGSGLPGMLTRLASERGALMTRHGRVANDFIFIRAPRDVLLQRTLEIAVHNIERRISNNVWEVTGPGIFTSLYADPEARPLFDDLPVLPVQEVRKFVLFRWDLEYKKNPDDWRNARAAGSIFQDLSL